MKRDEEGSTKDLAGILFFPLALFITAADNCSELQSHAKSSIFFAPLRFCFSGLSMKPVSKLTLKGELKAV